MLRYHSNLVLASPPLKPRCTAQIQWEKNLPLSLSLFFSYLEKKLDRTLSVSYLYAGMGGGQLFFLFWLVGWGLFLACFCF